MRSGASCSIPDDHIDPRRSALFMARSILREVRDGGASMLISLHKQATTTPKIRAAIQASTEPAWLVAERYGISEQTVWKWRKRDDVHDRSHTPHRLADDVDPGAGGRRGGAAQDASPAARRPARRGARVPEPACLALRPRPLPAAAWRGQPAGAEAEGAEARARQPSRPTSPATCIST